MYLRHLLGVSTILVATSFAASSSSCTGQQYNDLPGFPASNSGCYPLSYYQTSDLGQTNPSDAESRCKQQCTSMGTQCSSVVAQINKAADSNLYSGTCFFYASGSDPSGSRQCANTAYLLLGYKKDNTNACFASSSVAASRYCSSYLGIPIITSTVTTTPSPVSTTTTLTSPTTVTTTSTISATAAAFTTVTVTAKVTTTVTSTVTTSTLSTTTAVVTVTTSVRPPAKFIKRAATEPAPHCVTSGVPASRLSAACSCLSVPTSTTTKTITAVRSTITATTTTVPTLTSTTSTTVTSATITTTSTVTTTMVITSIATTTTTSTMVTTVTSTTTITSTIGPYIAPAYKSCNSPSDCPVDQTNPSGLNCVCASDNPKGFCYSYSAPSGGSCSKDSDCPDLYKCDTDVSVCLPPAYGGCAVGADSQ